MPKNLVLRQILSEKPLIMMDNEDSKINIKYKILQIVNCKESKEFRL